MDHMHETNECSTGNHFTIPAARHQRHMKATQGEQQK